MDKMGRLAGKVALITGAGGGVGRAAARLFAAEGARVGVLDVNALRAETVMGEIAARGNVATAIVADVTSGAEVRDAVQTIVDAYGRLDVLYNNASVWLPGDGPVTEVEDTAWERTLEVNLSGVRNGCRYAIPKLIECGGGSVINTASPDALRPEPGYDAYAASKGGVLALTLAVAQYYAPFGVRVNALMPGTIATGLTRDLLATDEGYREHILRTHILGRIGKPEDVASAALYLASDESSFVTGSTLWVDGGLRLGPDLPRFSPPARCVIRQSCGPGV